MEKERVHQHTSRLVLLAFFTALGLALSYLESLVPIPLGVPGAKPGLPNIVTVTLLYTLGPADAVLVSLARIILSGVMHNVGQLLTAVLLTDGSVLAYLPVLVAAGTLAGIVVGVASGLISRRASRLMNAVK